MSHTILLCSGFEDSSIRNACFRWKRIQASLNHSRQPSQRAANGVCGVWPFGAVFLKKKQISRDLDIISSYKGKHLPTTGTYLESPPDEMEVESNKEKQRQSCIDKEEVALKYTYPMLLCSL